MSVDARLFGDQDFIAVRAALIAEVGVVEAIVLTRIHFRANESYRHAYERDGWWWWRAPVLTLVEETGLTEKQVRRALEVLTEAGHVVTEKHQTEGRYDRAKSVRVNLNEGQMHLPSGANEDLPSGADVPSMKKIEDTPPTPSSNSASEASFEKAWASWPNKSGKAAAKKAWAKAVANHVKAVRAREVSGVPVDFEKWSPFALLADTVYRFGGAYARTTAPRFIPHLSSWLNQERWTDPMPVDQDRGARNPEPQQPKQFTVPPGHRILRDEYGHIIGTEPIE